MRRAILDHAKDVNLLELNRLMKKIDDILGNIGKRFALESYVHEEMVVRSRMCILRGNIDEAREFLVKSR